MKKRRQNALIFIVLINCLNIFSQSNDSIIIWSKERLKFKDFNLKENKFNKKFNNASALSNLTIMPIVTNLVKGNCNLVVLSVFNKNQSFIRVKNIQLLEHEQLHFDIYELICRRIRKRNNTLKKCKDKISNFYTYIDSINQYSKKFDKATNFGLNKKSQIKWSKKVKEELKSLSFFSFGS